MGHLLSRYGSVKVGKSVLARNRTWSTTFAKSRAFRHTPRTILYEYLARESNPGTDRRLVVAVPKTAVLSVTLARHPSVARSGVEPGPTASEADMLSGTPTGHVVSIPTWTRIRTKTLGGSCAIRYTIGTQEPTTGFAPASIRLQGGCLSVSSHVGKCDPACGGREQLHVYFSSATFQYASLTNFDQLSIRTSRSA